MKNISRIITATVLLAGTLLCTSCNKNGFFRKGGEITFGSRTGEAGTKTVYGSDVTGTTIWQYINWEVDDVFTIVSPQAGVDNDLSEKHIANYVVTSVEAFGDHQSKATVVVNEGGNGLCWSEGFDSYDFYAVYPSVGNGGAVSITHPEDGAEYDATADVGTVTAKLLSTPALPSGEGSTSEKTVTDGDATLTYTVYKPDMSYAVMTAQAKGCKETDSEPQVSLNFIPAFTAFEINLTSKDDEFSVQEISLNAGSEDGNTDYLAGTYTLKAGDLSTVAVSSTAREKSVTMNLGSDGLPLTATTGFTVTLFTLPVTNTGMITLKVKTTEGTASLQMTAANSDQPYQFEAGKKYRINMLKLGGTWKYKITISPDELPWDLIEESTTFSQNIQASPFNIKNATETANHYYPEGTKDYQVRTLNMDYDFFEVTFKPMAPLGGYWQLIPYNPPSGQVGMGTAAFKVEVWDADSNTGSTDLKGQIMNQTVTLHVTCVATDDQRTEDHAIIIKSLFSTSASFDENSTYSADSEIQDAHKDGSFSYWRFVIPAKVN